MYVMICRRLTEVNIFDLMCVSIPRFLTQRLMVDVYFDFFTFLFYLNGVSAVLAFSP